MITLLLIFFFPGNNNASLNRGKNNEDTVRGQGDRAQESVDNIQGEGENIPLHILEHDV